MKQLFGIDRETLDKKLKLLLEKKNKSISENAEGIALSTIGDCLVPLGSDFYGESVAQKDIEELQKENIRRNIELDATSQKEKTYGVMTVLEMEQNLIISLEALGKIASDKNRGTESKELAAYFMETASTALAKIKGEPEWCSVCNKPYRQCDISNHDNGFFTASNPEECKTFTQEEVKVMILGYLERIERSPKIDVPQTDYTHGVKKGYDMCVNEVNSIIADIKKDLC